MLTEFTAQTQVHHHEQELTERLERRRVAAERAVAEHGGERLALIAFLARQARAPRRTASRPSIAGC